MSINKISRESHQYPSEEQSERNMLRIGTMPLYDAFQYSMIKNSLYKRIDLKQGSQEEILLKVQKSKQPKDPE